MAIVLLGFFSNYKSNSCSSIVIKIFDLVLKEGKLRQISSVQGLDSGNHLWESTVARRYAVVRASASAVPWRNEKWLRRLSWWPGDNCGQVLGLVTVLYQQRDEAKAML